MIKNIIIYSLGVLLLSCVTERLNEKKKNIFIGPDEDMVPILIEGYVMGEDIGEDSVSYPLHDVKISVSGTYGNDGITLSTLSTKRGFFSISPDYIPKREKNKLSYVVVFQKEGFETGTKLLQLPSEEASRLNVVLKRIK